MNDKIYSADNSIKPAWKVVAIELFCIKPIGIDFGMTESQVSYLARLADAHCVTVGTLIQFMAKDLGKPYILEVCNNGGSWLYDNGAALNGFGEQSQSFSQVLLKLTGINTSILTLASWSSLCSGKELLRKHKAWCPLCFQDWKKGNLPIYEPLIWSFRAVNICGIHGTFLDMHCPQCGSLIPILSRKTRNGYCSFCGCWLGSANVHYLNSQLDQEQFAWDNICDLLRYNDLAIVSKNYFKVFIEKLIRSTGSLNTFSKFTNIPKSTVSEWQNGLHQPSLKNVLNLCYSLGINILSIFDENQSFNLRETNKFEYSYSKVTRRKIDWNNIESILIGKIDSSETPSVKKVAMELDVDSRLLYYHFPVLCKEIANRHSLQIKENKKHFLESGCKQIREALISANKVGIEPTRRNIEKMLPSEISFRDKTFYDCWKNLRFNESPKIVW